MNSTYFDGALGIRSWLQFVTTGFYGENDVKYHGSSQGFLTVKVPWNP